MSKFKVGDRVRVTKDGPVAFSGECGTVTQLRRGIWPVVVRLCAGDEIPFSQHELEMAPAVKTRLYLAGPMRGIPFFNFPAFDKAAAELRAAGYDAWSPAEHDREVYGEDFEKAYPTGEEDGDFDLRAALAADTKTICEWADGIALLDGWEESSGASAEEALGRALGLPTNPYRAWFAAGEIDKFNADDWAEEREDIIERFTAELRKATGDGSKKRQAGEKPPWYEDDSHEAAIFSHITKWKKGETTDPDSGAHSLVHGAWRMLAVACRETGNTP